jgi:hypothetical protein
MTHKNVKIVSGLLMLLLGLLLGCAGKSEVLKVNLGQEVSLHIGQTAQIENEHLAIRFNGITGDSRCPRGVLCIRAGEVTGDVTVTHNGSASDITLTQSGLTEPPAEATYQDYKLVFSVEPYPEAGKQMSPEDYILNLTVEK